MDELYKRIKNRRTEIGMTQTELARKVGYADKGMISRIENGKIDLSQTQLVKIADALETTPSFLMGWSDVKYKLPPFNDFIDCSNDFFESEYDEYEKRLHNLMPYAQTLVLLEQEKKRELLKAADGCTDDQIDIAINMLNTFKKGGS